MTIDTVWLDQHLTEHETLDVAMPNWCCHFPGTDVQHHEVAA